MIEQGIVDSLDKRQLVEVVKNLFLCEADERSATHLSKLNDLLIDFKHQDRLAIVTKQIIPLICEDQSLAPDSMTKFKRVKALLNDSSLQQAGCLDVLVDIKKIVEAPDCFLLEKIIPGLCGRIDTVLEDSGLPAIARAISKAGPLRPGYQVHKPLHERPMFLLQDLRERVWRFIKIIISIVVDLDHYIHGDRTILQKYLTMSFDEALLPLFVRDYQQKQPQEYTPEQIANIHSSLQIYFEFSRRLEEIKDMKKLHCRTIHEIPNPFISFIPDVGVYIAEEERDEGLSFVREIEEVTLLMLVENYRANLMTLTNSEGDIDKQQFQIAIQFFLAEAVATDLNPGIRSSFCALRVLMEELHKKRRENPKLTQQLILLCQEKYLNIVFKFVDELEKYRTCPKDSLALRAACLRKDYFIPTRSDSRAHDAYLKCFKLFDKVYKHVIKLSNPKGFPCQLETTSLQEAFKLIAEEAKKQLRKFISDLPTPQQKLQFLRELTKYSYPFIDNNNRGNWVGRTGFRQEIDEQIIRYKIELAKEAEQVHVLPTAVSAAVSAPAQQPKSRAPAAPLPSTCTDGPALRFCRDDEL